LCAFCADILAQKNSNPKHSFVIFGNKILAQNVDENYSLTSFDNLFWRAKMEEI